MSQSSVRSSTPPSSRGNAQAVAMRAFGIPAGSGRSKDYVTVPVSWAEDVWNLSQTAPILDDPIGSIGGAGATLGKNFLCVVFGSAGVGKSELLKELCRAGESDPKARKVFPIRLSSCRMLKPGPGHTPRPVAGGLPDEELPAAKLAEFLFSAIAAQEKIDIESFVQMSFQDIDKGQMILALDGLDEIIASKKQHTLFWQALWVLLEMNLPRGFRLIVTCRTDYLNALGLYGRWDFIRFLTRGKNRLPVHFLGLDFFNPGRVQSYLRKRDITSGPLKEAADRLHESARGLGEMMQRPLLLTLLCTLDVLKQRDAGSPPLDTTALLEKLTSEAERNQATGAIRWNRDKLARATLALFTRPAKTDLGAPAFSVSEFDSFLDVEAGTQLTPEQRWTAINPCPFLRRDSDSEAQFTHSIFYEYFVARGMFLQVSQEKDGQDSLIDFDRYVLTPEMRRFLRGSLNEERWRERTLRSYCLEDRGPALQHWPKPAWALERYDELNRIRYELLEFITEPEVYDKEKAMATVQEYLKLDQELLFPAYRMYSLEAVAVFLGTYRWHPASPVITKRLEEVLIRMLNHKENEERKHGHDWLYKESLNQLVLKIMDIGKRLKISAVMKKEPAA